MQRDTVRPETVQGRHVIHEVADLSRLAIGIAFIASAVVNAVLTLREFSIYLAFADDAWLPGYESAWRELAVPALPALLLLVVVFEAILGLLILSSARDARLGLLAAAAFVAMLSPANLATLINLPLAVLLLLLAWPSYQHTAWVEWRAWLRHLPFPSPANH